MGLLPICIFGFGFYFPGGLLGGTLEPLFCWGYVGIFLSIFQTYHGGY